MKDEERFLDEWLAYHRLIGVDHFFLYDHASEPPLRELVAPHREYVTSDRLVEGRRFASG